MNTIQNALHQQTTAPNTPIGYILPLNRLDAVLFSDSSSDSEFEGVVNPASSTCNRNVLKPAFYKVGEEDSSMDALMMATSVSNKACTDKATKMDKKVASSGVPMKPSISNTERKSSFNAKKTFALEIEEFVAVRPQKAIRTEQELKYEESDSDIDEKIANPAEIEPELDLSRGNYRQSEKSNATKETATNTLAGKKRTRAEARFVSAEGVKGHET